MTNIEIIPFVGCSTIKFGMTKAEVEELLGSGQYNMCSHVYPASAKENNPFPTMEGFYFHSSKNQNINYRIRFSENRVSEISIYAPENLHKNSVHIQLYGVDLFENTAETVIAQLEKQSTCTWDSPDKDLSYFYTFHKIGFELWREGVFHPKLYNDPEYKKEFDAMCPENQEYELRFQYFQLATLRTKELQETLFNR